MQGDHYHIDYLTYPERPQLRPRLVYNDNDLVFGFGTTERTPLLVAYYVRASGLPRQLEFFRKMGILTEVDGDRKPEEVFAEMVSALGIGND